MTHAASGRLRRPGHPESVRIAVDLLGGDNAPAVVVDGVARARGADPDLRLLLVGTQEVTDEAQRVLGQAGTDHAAVESLIVDRAVGMSDPAARGADPRTTIGAAMHALATGEVDAVVSAGSSGAIVAAAVLALGRLPDVRRPALAAVLPALGGPLVLLDVGAGLQTEPSDLVQHAVLGSLYAQRATGVAEPRVGLLSVGSEPGKGDRLRQLADAALQTLGPPGRYAGLVEGHEVVTGHRADVVVTDGFTGNVLLKGLEAALATVSAAELTPPRAAVLLGVDGTVVVCHGAASADDIASGLALAAGLIRGQSVIRSTSSNPSTGSDVPVGSALPAGPATLAGPASFAEVS